MIRALTVIVLTFAYILVTGPPMLLIAWIAKRGDWVFRVGRVGARFVRLAGRRQTEGAGAREDSRGNGRCVHGQSPEQLRSAGADCGASGAYRHGQKGVLPRSHFGEGHVGLLHDSRGPEVARGGPPRRGQGGRNSPRGPLHAGLSRRHTQSGRATPSLQEGSLCHGHGGRCAHRAHLHFRRAARSCARETAPSTPAPSTSRFMRRLPRKDAPWRIGHES